MTIIQNSGVLMLDILKSMEILSGRSELSIIIVSQVSAVDGCPLSGVPL